jgi:hypothetical protein
MELSSTWCNKSAVACWAVTRLAWFRHIFDESIRERRVDWKCITSNSDLNYEFSGGRRLTPVNSYLLSFSRCRFSLGLNPYRVRFHIHFILPLHYFSILTGCVFISISFPPYIIFQSLPGFYFILPLHYFSIITGCLAGCSFFSILFSPGRPAPPLVPAQFFIPGAPTSLFRSILSVPPMCYSTHTCVETTCTAGS